MCLDKSHEIEVAPGFACLFESIFSPVLAINLFCRYIPFTFVEVDSRLSHIGLGQPLSYLCMMRCPAAGFVYFRLLFKLI